MPVAGYAHTGLVSNLLQISQTEVLHDRTFKVMDAAAGAIAELCLAQQFLPVDT